MIKFLKGKKGDRLDQRKRKVTAGSRWKQLHFTLVHDKSRQIGSPGLLYSLYQVSEFFNFNWNPEISCWDEPTLHFLFIQSLSLFPLMLQYCCITYPYSLSLLLLGSAQSRSFTFLDCITSHINLFLTVYPIFMQDQKKNEAILTYEITLYRSAGFNY